MTKPKYATREHRAERKRWAAIVAKGEAWCAEDVCLMPSRWIPPGSRWDLAHARGDQGYLGAAHFPL